MGQHIFDDLALSEIKNSLVDMAHPDICMTESQWKQVEELEALLHLPYLVKKQT